MFSEGLARQVVHRFLYCARSALRERNVDRARLPWWLTRAQIRVGWIGQSLVAAFDGAPAHARGDQYEIRGPIRADLSVLLDVEDYQPVASSLEAQAGEGFILMIGEADGRSRLLLDGERPFSFFDCGYAGYHGPRALMNLFLDLGSDSGDSRTTIGARFVPFALYVHERDTDDPDRLWALTKERLLEALVRIAESPSGDYYEAEKDRPHRFSAFAAAEQAVAVTKERGVVVLGNYKDPHLTELVSIKQALVSKGYDAKLIVELAESPMMSNEEKVRLYAQASRFCVMVDREPSGHVAEYGYLREQRVILAFLQPTGSGSTFMIGDASLVDVRHLATFKFKGSALSVLDQAVEWAEGLVRERENAYREAYPWRGT